jgi:hypothetical protein
MENMSAASSFFIFDVYPCTCLYRKSSIRDLQIKYNAFAYRGCGART